MKNNTINIERVLDYCDVPQLFLARDIFDTQYLCLLYDDEPQCRYTAIRISNEQYSAFCLGKKDLRTLFSSPEYAGEYFDVAGDTDSYTITALAMKQLPEDRMPAEGYFVDNSDSDVHTVSVPKRERNLFYRLMHRHGWVAM